MAEGEELGELVGLLEDRKPEVRRGAAELVAGLTAEGSGLALLRGVRAELCPRLLRLVHDASPEVAKLGISALVNLSQDKETLQTIVELKAVGRCMQALRDAEVRPAPAPGRAPPDAAPATAAGADPARPPRPSTAPRLQYRDPQYEVLMMLLANLTFTEQGSMDLLQRGQEGMEGLFLTWIVKKLGSVGKDEVADWVAGKDKGEHLASVLMNIAQYPDGRRLLADRLVVQNLVPLSRTGSVTRRRGVLGAVKNCCMQAAKEGFLEGLLDPELGLIPAVLAPINGRPPKEADDLVRETAAEAVLALTMCEEGVAALWEAGAPDALKKGYEFEENPGVCGAMEACAQVFLSFNKDGEAGAGGDEAAAAAEPEERVVEGYFKPGFL